MKVELYKGSILDIQADVIVNAANSFLQHAGGLARIIHGIATGIDDYGYNKHPWTLQVERQRIQDYRAFVGEYHRVSTGDCIFGPPGLLDYKSIAHAVGPIWKDGSLHEAELLYSAYRNTMDRAFGNYGYKSIVFPAISAGIFGAPAHEVATAASDAIAIWSHIDDLSVTIAVPEEHIYETFESRFEEVGFIA
jgi:O-acetyl-ADP-ribose deacetylase (regulator of RNase III)